jgi:hypothetical protein
MSGVTGGNAEALARAFPGADVHEPPDAKLPGEDTVAIVPVLLPLTEPRIATGIAGGSTAGAVVLELIGVVIEPGMRLAPMEFIVVAGLAETAVVVEFTLITDGESSWAAGEQFTLVPGRVGSSANGGAARVVAGAPGMVAAEKRLVNGLGPAKGDETMAPGVVGSAIAVVPTVDIWASELLQPSQSTATTKKKIRIADQLRNSSRSRGLGLRCDLATVRNIHSGIENDQVTCTDTLSNLHLLAEIAGD